MIQIFLLSAISGKMFFFHQNLGMISNFHNDMKYNYLYEFDKYKKYYNRSYSDIYEHWYRYYIFEENYHTILNHNNFKYKLGINNFTDRLPNELPKGYKGFSTLEILIIIIIIQLV